MRERGLARTGRAPENDGGELIRLDRPPQRPINRSDVLLANKIHKLSRPQTFSQWSLNRYRRLWSTK
jgi:hypothetical protein